MSAIRKATENSCWDIGTRSGLTRRKLIYTESRSIAPMLVPVVKLKSFRTSTMKIEAITLREIQMPLVHFFETSFGRTYSRRILLVTVHCEGVDGWGECVAGEDPFYSSEWIESAWPTITHYLIPMLLGQKHRVGAGVSALFAKVRGAPHGEGRPRKRAVGSRGHTETTCRSGSCSAARGAKFPAAFPSAFKIPSSNCSRRFRSNLPPDIGASRSK